MARQSLIQITTIQVPASTPWDPNLAQQAILALFTLQPTLTFLIRAYRSNIVWQIETLHAVTEIVAKSFYSVYPQAQISSRSKRAADIGFFSFPLEAGAPFFVPLAFAGELRTMDPLAAILTPMADLAEGEEVVFSLALHTPKRDYAKIGRKQIRKSANSLFRFGSPGRAVQSALFETILGAENQAGRYESDIQQVAEQKVRMPVKEVELDVKVLAASLPRAQYLFALLQPALAWFGRPGLNALIPAGNGSYRLVLSVPEIAALWHLPSKQCRLAGIEWAAHPDVPLPVELGQIREGVRLGTSTYQGKSESVRVSDQDRNTHVNLIGRTRTGKSNLLHHMIRQDIMAGYGVAVIDPHGDLVEDILTTSIPEDRERDVILFDLDESERIIGLNLLAQVGKYPKEKGASMALAVLRKFFGSQWNAGRMEDTLYAALISLMGVKGAVIQDIPRLFNDKPYRLRILKDVDDTVALDYWYNEFEGASESQQRELALPINHRVRRLYRDRRMRRIMCASDCLDFQAVIDENKIFLANLRGSASAEGEILGALLLAKFQMAAMSRSDQDSATRRIFYLYVDEVQKYVTSSLDQMLSEVSKEKVYLVIANQFLAQLEGKTLKAVLGNVGTNIIFRCGQDEAQIFSSLVRPNFEGDDLINLSRFHAVVKTQFEGKTLPAFVVKTDPPPIRAENAPERALRIRELSRRRYGKPVAEIDAELLARYRQVKPTIEDAFDEEEMDFLD